MTASEQLIPTRSATRNKLVASITAAGVLIASLMVILAIKAARLKRSACLANQQQIYGAIVAKALEGNLYRGDHISTNEILPLIGDRFPLCPSGGEYTIPVVGKYPICSCHGDLLTPAGKVGVSPGMDSALRERPN
jgi:hypothetical protein